MNKKLTPIIMFALLITTVTLFFLVNVNADASNTQNSASLVSATNIAEMPIISLNKLAVATEVGAAAGITCINDGNYNTFWNSGSFGDGNPTWIAIKLEAQYKKVLLKWTNLTGDGIPSDYSILASSDSTNGVDGTWKSVSEVTDNTFLSREHSFDFNGMSWAKMICKRAVNPANTSIQLSEIDIHDMSNINATQKMDTWLFTGDSVITSGIGQGTSHVNGFSSEIHKKFDKYYPMVINRGFSSNQLDNILKSVDTMLKENPDCQFIAIMPGISDVKTAGLDTTKFQSNLTTIIQKVKSAGKTVIISKIHYAEGAEYQSIPQFNAIIDELSVSNQLPVGPDFYTYFIEHPDQLTNNITPNKSGVLSMIKLWVESVQVFYGGLPKPSAVVTKKPLPTTTSTTDSTPSVINSPASVATDTSTALVTPVPATISTVTVLPDSAKSATLPTAAKEKTSRGTISNVLPKNANSDSTEDSNTRDLQTPTADTSKVVPEATPVVILDASTNKAPSKDGDIASGILDTLLGFLESIGQFIENLMF